MSDEVDVTVVCPVYNGVDTLSSFISQLVAVLARTTQAYEIILVDDGCPYDSWQVIQSQCTFNASIKGIRLSRNFGQQIAVSAGLSFASGRYIVVMDADLQNPPNTIPDLLVHLRNGVDIVYTVSKVRNNWIDGFTSIIFWFVINKVFSTNMIPNQLMMKGFNRKFLSAFKSYNERIRTVAGITHDIGMRSIVIPVANQRRVSGKGNYGFFKRVNLMIDIVLAVTSRPLDVLIHIGLLSFIASIFMIFWTVAAYLLNPGMPSGYTTLVTLITFFGSMNLLVLGIVGRYLSSIYMEVRNRPMFIVQDKINI